MNVKLVWFNIDELDEADRAELGMDSDELARCAYFALYPELRNLTIAFAHRLSVAKQKRASLPFEVLPAP